MSDWITAIHAAMRATDACITPEALVEWARHGLLRTRARTGLFSDDDPHQTQTFPLTPPTDELERQVCGPWPDVPVSFWDGIRTAIWRANTFEAEVRYFCDFYQEQKCVSITLRDVTFHEGDLNLLLED